MNILNILWENEMLIVSTSFLQYFVHSVSVTDMTYHDGEIRANFFKTKYTTMLSQKQITSDMNND